MGEPDEQTEVHEDRAVLAATGRCVAWIGGFVERGAGGEASAPLSQEAGKSSSTDRSAAVSLVTALGAEQ